MRRLLVVVLLAAVVAGTAGGSPSAGRAWGPCLIPPPAAPWI